MLKKGDKVAIVKCAEAGMHAGKKFTCTSDQFKMCGCDMIMLDGISGAFDVDCLMKVPE